VCDPKEFGRWFDPFIRDDEEFTPGEDEKKKARPDTSPLFRSSLDTRFVEFHH